MFQFYDDELQNLILITGKNFRQIIDYTSTYDFHPPLQYILNKISLDIFGLNEFWLSFPSILFLLISIVICGLLVYKITGSVLPGVVCSIIILLNPLVLLWGSSIRWYPLWSLLSILSLYLFLSLWTSKQKKLIKSLILILVLSLSIYTNYQTISFLAAILLTAITLDIRKRNFNRVKITLLITAGVFFLFLPYLQVFLFHQQNYLLRKSIYHPFTGTSPLASGGNYIFSILFGNSIYPWMAEFFVPCTIALLALLSAVFIKLRNNNKHTSTNAELISAGSNKQFFESGESIVFLFVIYLGLILLLQNVFTESLSVRGMIILPMLLTVSITIWLHRFYKTYANISKSRSLYFCITITWLSVLFIWLIGSYNVFAREHLHKTGLAIPVDKIVKTVNNIEKQSNNQSVIITTDPVITYYLLKNGNSEILSPYLNELQNLLQKKNLAKLKEDDEIILIESNPGALLPLQNELNDYISYINRTGRKIGKPLLFGYDPDYSMKQKFFPASDLKKWKYEINTYTAKDKWDITYLNRINDFRVY